MTAALALHLTPEGVANKYSPEEATKYVEVPSEIKIHETPIKPEESVTTEKVDSDTGQITSPPVLGPNPNPNLQLSAIPLGRELIPQGPGAMTATVNAAGAPEITEGTSLKNATADLERAGIGIQEANPIDVQEMAPAWERSGEVLKENPLAGKTLADSLVSDPKRGLTGDESALLLRHKTQLFNELNNAAEKTFQGTESEKAQARLDYDAKKAEFESLLDAIHKRGNEWGREGRWRQALAAEDFSFATRERLLEAAKQRPLNDQERTELHSEVEKLRMANDTLQKSIKDSELANAARAANEAYAEASREASKTIHPKILEVAERLVVGFEKRAQAAEVRLREKLSRASSGIDPTILADVVEIGAGKLARYAWDSAKWSAEMIKTFGEKIQPYLEEGYKQANALISELEKRIKEPV